MKVYRLTVKYGEGYLASHDIDNIAAQLSKDASEKGAFSDSEAAVLRGEIETIREKGPALEVGMKIEQEMTTAECVEMTQEEYAALPDWDGW